jgi:hypothetical protein
MRTTFRGIRLFNDNIFCPRYIFILNGKGWAESLTVERQRERESESEGER